MSEPISTRAIVIEQTFDAPRAAVWAAWTSAAALQAWLADEVHMALRIGGPFEVLFLPPGTPERGSEGCTVLSFVPERMLSFSWNAPPHLAHTRRRHTWVVLDFADAGEGTRLRLTHTGWPVAGFGADGHPDWPATFAYFEQAWPRVFDGLRGHLEG